MLKQLSIHNYALIEEVEVHLEAGLSIITGETGAGKSILLGALGLILGDRADSAALRDQNKKCVVEGLFNISAYDLEAFFSENELDYDGQTTLRREIIPGGKSRAFVNDTPVTLNILKDLGEQLIDIHAQHHTRYLNSFGFQLSLLDAYAANREKLNDYKAVFQHYSNLKLKKRKLEEDLAQAELNRSFIEFQFQELSEAKLENPNELQDLDTELSVLTHAELIKQSLQFASELLENSEFNVNASVLNAKNALLKAGNYHQDAAGLAGRLESVHIELKDLSAEIERLDNSLHLDQERLSDLNYRQDLLNRLMTKHRVSDLGDLISLRNDFETQLQVITSGGEELENLSIEIAASEKKLVSISADLSASRQGAAGVVSQKVNELLVFLGMQHAELKIEIEQSEELRATGRDHVVFLFRSNLGTAFQSIEKVASGGELSRIMLCLKAVNASKSTMPTIIFDEIDTGVSGEVASKMGHVLRRLGQHMQVISISHLPQIAGKGQAHYKVSKEVRGESTYSKINKLSHEERVKEIAGMISGAQITEAALENARALLQE